MRERRRTVERPFGTIKSWMGATHFQMRTPKHVGIEMALHVLAYNMKTARTHCRPRRDPTAVSRPSVRGPGSIRRGEMRHLVGVGLGEGWPGRGARDVAAAGAIVRQARRTDRPAAARPP
jgi:hypothetical protein